MKILLLVFLVICSLNAFAGAEEVTKEWNALKGKYSQGGCPSEQLEIFFQLYVSWLDSLNPPATPDQVRQMAERMSRLQTGNTGSFSLYERRFRAEQPQRVAVRRGESRVPASVMPHRSMAPTVNPLYETVGHDALWDRVLADFEDAKVKIDKAKNSKAKDASAKVENANRFLIALRTVLQYLAGSNDPRQEIAAGEIIEPKMAGEILISWLQLFEKHLLSTNDRDAVNAMELSSFAVRWQALRTFGGQHNLSQLSERLEGMRRLLSANPLFHEKAGSVARLQSHAPAYSSSWPLSWVGSALSRAASVFTHPSRQGSIKTERASSPARGQDTGSVAIVNGRRIHLDVTDNSGGGECLFLAAGTTRTNLIQWVLANMDTNTGIQELFNQAILADEIDDVNAWLNRMFTPGFEGWGGDLEIGLIALRTDTQIVVFTQQPDGNWGSPHAHGPQAAQNHIWVGYNGVHYVTLVANDQQAVSLPKREEKSGKITIEQLQAAIKQAVVIGRFDLAHNLENAQAIIDALNDSKETISPALRSKLLAAGFKITGSKGKYVITQVAQTGNTNSHDDRGPPPPGAGAAGASGADDATTGERDAKKPRTEFQSKPAPKSKQGGRKHALRFMPVMDVLVKGAAFLFYGINNRASSPVK